MHGHDAAPADAEITVVFADAVAPALTAGEYEVEVTQAIAGDIGIPDHHEYRHIQPVRVTGPHFALGPRDVFSVHPPAGSDADWSGRLPSVVLSQRGLPWVIETRADQRAPVGAAPMNAPAPWCAILLLAHEELTAEDPEAAESPTGTRQILLTDYLTPPPGVRGPAFTQRQIARFRQEHPAEFTVTTIDVPAAVFSRVAPSLHEARLLAHTRTVRDEVTARLDAQAAGEYAAVLGNRLAAGSASGVYVAHLVSIEGFEDALPPARLGGAGRIRLLSLAGWTFTSRISGEAFADVMQRLDTGPLRMPDALGEPQGTDEGVTAHDGDPRDPATLVRKALELGYTAADYRTRLGERTVAWYRGPLLPVAMKPNQQPPFGSAEAALVYDPGTGMFDVSFAAAWQAGRLLALAERDVATELAAWVRRSRRRLLRALARDRLARAYPLLALGGTDEAPAAATERAATAGAQARALLARQLAPDSPPPTPSRQAAAVPARPPRRGGVWGVPVDLTGLLDQLGRLPGLIAPDELPGLLAGPGTPTAALLAAVRSPSATEAGGRPVPAPVERTRPPSPPRAQVGRIGSLPAEFKALLADGEAAAAAVRGEPPPSGVVEWLERLGRLHTVPFPLLVPDTRALPPESIRFAHLDGNWISALVDGALSIAAVDEPEHAVLDLLRPTVHRALRRPPQCVAAEAGVPCAAEEALRPNDETGQSAPREPAADPAPVLSGFLLRSTAVADFPGLGVRAYADRARRRPLAPRRLERLSPTVLFALFEGRVGSVELATPAQGSGFGVLSSDRNPAGEIYLRGIGGAYPSGEQIPAAVVPVPFRQDPDPSVRVLDVVALHASVLRSLAERYAPQPVPPFGPGAFGLQLVVGGEAQVFENLAAPAAEPASAQRKHR